MTAEVPDRMVYQRRVYAMLTTPLEDYFDDPRHPRPEAFAMVSTACGRGYVAHWSIKRNKLYLARVHPIVMPLGCGR